ncbi:Uncharacterised protein [Klebsiella pneumoniae]|nr:Uncharacterised protein [Klebsiella pneumoniae]
MALAQIALAGLTQYIDIKRLFERRLHPMAKKHHSVDVELQQSIHFMSDVSQIVTLVGHVGLFQDIDFTPDQQRGEKQHCDKTSVNHMPRASQVVALF